MRIHKIENCRKCNKPLRVLLEADGPYTEDEYVFKKLKKLEWCECLYPS